MSTVTRRTSAIDVFPELRLELEDASLRRSSRVSLHSTKTDRGGHRQSLLTDSIRLKTSDASTNHAAYAMLFTVFADAINGMCINPNIPLMTTPGAHPDSFPSVEPFDPTTANYVLKGFRNIALVLSSFFFGWLATKIGSRNCSLILMMGSTVFTLVQYFFRFSYWGFAVFYTINALFGSSVAVGNGYMCLIFKGDRMKIDAYIGYLLATMVFSRSLGGLFAVLFPSELFKPLIPASALSFVAFFVVYRYVLDPSTADQDEDEAEEIDDKSKSPESLDRCTFANIVIGAFIDNVGSCGLVPLAFAPVLYQKFFLDFEMQGLEPVMSYSQFIWLYSMIAIAVVPSALVTPWCYKKFGIAITCVLANVFTGLTLLALVFAAMLPATRASYAICTCIIYIGFPLGVVSNLSTSPLLDRVAPLRMKTLLQGLNSAIFDLANGLSPILLGFVSDLHGYIYMLWICVGIQAIASLANLPLIFNPLLKDKSANGPLKDEPDIDEPGMEKLLAVGKYVSIRDQYKVNKARADKGEPCLRVRYGKYSQEDYEVFSKLTACDLEFVRNAAEQRLAVLHDNTEAKEGYVEAVNSSRCDRYAMDEMKQELGEWVADHLHNNGYFLGLENPQIFKGLFLHCFPPIIKGTELTVDNVEDALIQSIKQINNYVERLESDKRKGFWKKLK